MPVTEPRSHLYSLQPIGMGSPQVESLTGYVSRLADAHCVSPGSLIASEFKCLLSQPQGHSYLHQVSGCTEVLNSTGRMASELVQALGTLTLRHDLRYLTMLPWANVLPAKGLLRRTRAWCPMCYREWRNNGQTVYEPLLWALSVVSVCPDHHQRLSSQCPHCQRKLPSLGWHSQPGYCCKCQYWLGAASEETAQVVSSVELEWQRWVAKNVGELLICAPSITEAPAREVISRSLSICIAQNTEGNIAEFARRIGMLKSAVWQWQAGIALPQMLILLKICHALGVTLLDFLLTPQALDLTSLVTVHQNPCLNPPPPKQRIDVEKLQQSLQAVTVEDPPPSMEAIAQRLGHSARSLRRQYPILCSAISKRYLSHREKVRIEKVEQSCQEIRQIALQLFSEGIDPTRSQVTKFLNKPAYFREPLVDATLERLRQELGL